MPVIKGLDDFDAVEKHKACKINNVENDDAANYAIAFSIYGREEILAYAEDSSKDNEDEVSKKYNEFITKARKDKDNGQNEIKPVTKNKLKKIINDSLKEKEEK